MFTVAILEIVVERNQTAEPRVVVCGYVIGKKLNSRSHAESVPYMLTVIMCGYTFRKKLENGSHSAYSVYGNHVS